MYDIIIMGAGVTGCFIARELSRYKLNVLVLEKNNDVGNETTSANSAIVHSGYDPVPGTLKAKLNVEGNKMYDKVCEELRSYKRNMSKLPFNVASNYVSKVSLKESTSTSKIANPDDVVDQNLFDLLNN